MSQARSQGWTGLQRRLHWLVALAIVVEVPAGFFMAWTYAAKSADGQARHLTASQAHHTIGLRLIPIVLLRLVSRWRNAAPALPDGMFGWQARAARATQALLYALLLLIPLSGWAALSSMAAGGGYPAPPIWLFGHDGFGPGGIVPHIVPPVAWNADTLLRYGTFARAHVWMLVLGAALLAAHIGAALHHHFVRRDGVLARMVRGE